MDLLIDIGNSRIKWAMLTDDAVHDGGSAEHADGKAMDVMLDVVATAPDGVLAANVAGDRVARRLTELVRERWDLPVRFAVTQQSTGSLRNGYDDFLQLGIDRWLAMIAATGLYTGPVCIVDAGTAVTIDVVMSGGVHLGGYIMPGLDLMRRSLGERTSDLRRLAGDQPWPISEGMPMPGRSTSEAIEGGLLAAACCLVARVVAMLRKQDTEPTLVVTGGAAQQLIPHLDMPARCHPQLVLEGLARYKFDERLERREEGG